MPKKRGRGTKVISISMEVGLLEQLDEHCDRSGRSRSYILDRMIREGLIRDQLPPKKPIIPPPPITRPVNYQEEQP